MSKKLLWWLPTVIYVSLIIMMSFRPAPRLPALHLDKLIHGAAYAVLSFLAYASFCHSGYKRPVVQAVVLAVLIGILDEYLQKFTHTRNPSVYDLLADGLGAVLGSFAAKKMVKNRSRNTSTRTQGAGYDGED